ncbi:MAG: serine hydrolase domain-containing protein [Bdellovibrionales bacterium]
MFLSNGTRLTFEVLKNWLSFHASYGTLPGMQLCIRKRNAVVFNQAVGRADQKSWDKLSTDHLFPLLDQSKMVTSCACFMLQEEGFLSLSEPVSDYLPEIAGHWNRQARSITIRDLLTHRSGFVRSGLDSSCWERQQPFPSTKELLHQASLADIVYEPNTCSKYSDFGFALLGLALSEAVRTPYKAFVRDNIFSKIRKNLILPDYDETAKEPYAQIYSKLHLHGKPLRLNPVPVNTFAPAIGGYATAESASAFFYEFLYGDKLISKQSQREIKGTFWPALNSKDYWLGHGIEKTKIGEKEFLSHAGESSGFLTQSKVYEPNELIVSLNTHAQQKPLPLIPEIMILIEKMNSVFSPSQEGSKATISPPLLNVTSGSLFVLGYNYAVEVPLFTETPGSDAAILKKTEKGFISHDRAATYPVGEATLFNRTSRGEILSVTQSGSRLIPLSAFFKRHAPLQNG